MEKMKWEVKHFDELSALEYHQILYLRTEIFVVEQNCPYQEVDHKDLVAYHVFGLNEQNELVAVARILPENVSYKEVSIGRVAIKQTYRGTGLADKLMNVTFSAINQLFGKKNIRISAQEYLLIFYSRHGFKAVSETYLEDDIPHVEMLKNK